MWIQEHIGIKNRAQIQHDRTVFPPVVRELLKVEKWFKLTHHSIICNEVNLNTVNGEHLCDG